MASGKHMSSRGTNCDVFVFEGIKWFLAAHVSYFVIKRIAF